jgi:hypothetical protein
MTQYIMSRKNVGIIGILAYPKTKKGRGYKTNKLHLFITTKKHDYRRKVHIPFFTARNSG